MPTISARPWYKDWFKSLFYHKLYFEKNGKEAEEFIHKLISFLNPPAGSRMLDTACRKGRESSILAAMNYEVTGIDYSFSNIEAAKQSEKDNLSFYQHDTRLPFWINYFDYAFNFFTGFGHFATRREHDDATRSISTSLKPGGIFVIDFLNVHFAEEHLVHHETKNITGTGYDIHNWDDATDFYKKISISDASLNTPLEFTEKITKFSLGDFTDMLAFQQMQVLEVFGNYHLDPYDVRKTPRMIIVARKKMINPQPGEKEKRLYSDGRKTDQLS